MVAMSLPDLVEPSPPDEKGTVVQMEKWKVALRTYESQVKARKRNTERAYALVLGQCSQALRNRMEADSKWNNIDTTSNVIDLLSLIQKCINQRQTRKYDEHALLEAEIRVFTFKQGKHMSNHDDYERFKDNVTTLERLGGEIGCQAERIKALIEASSSSSSSLVTSVGRERAKTQAKDRYLAVLFLINCDQRRYGSLLRDIENEYTRGTNTYPLTLNSAYDYVVNYRPDRYSQNGNDEGGMAFVTQHQQGTPDPGRGAAGRGGGRGRNGPGRGNVGRGGRGSHISASIPEEKTTNTEDAQYLLANADNLGEKVDDYFLITRLEHCFQMPQVASLKQNALLLDSCSTVNLIADHQLLQGVHKVNKPMRVRCNAGVRSTNLMGWLGTFPEAVWHDPNAAANILSLYTVKKYYRVKYDSSIDDAFIVSDSDGNEYRFIPTGNGLYAYQRQHDEDWAFVSTVAEKREQYTKRGYQAALRARQIQNILMYPSSKQFQDIIANNLLPNSPVRRDDITAAEDIFGCNIGALKGKTVHSPGTHVDGRTDGIPSAIKQRYGDIILSIDIMFINKMPFFITKSQNLHFGTVEFLSNRQISTVKSALANVLGSYNRRGLQVTTINADPEFEPLDAMVRNVQFNFCAQNEHVQSAVATTHYHTHESHV
jgi:hypothetical protein